MKHFVLFICYSRQANPWSDLLNPDANRDDDYMRTEMKRTDLCSCLALF